MDKRIIKTRSAVFHAVFDLSTQKPLDKITVLELCEKAGINKSTFYLHYTSIEDCFKKCFDTFTDGVIRVTDNIKYLDVAYHPEETIDMILDLVEQYIDFIANYKNSMVYDSSTRILKERFVQAICKTNNLTIENTYHEVAKVTFLVGGCLDTITQMLPYYNRAELRYLMIDVMKRKA